SGASASNCRDGKHAWQLCTGDCSRTLSWMAAHRMADNTTEALRLKYSRLLGIDRAVFFAIAGKIWSLSAGLVTTLLIAGFFSPDLQGYYYTFQAVLAIQAIAELGLGSVLTYYASHEWAKLALDRDGEVTGDAEAMSRLVSLG